MNIPEKKNVLCFGISHEIFTQMLDKIRGMWYNIKHGRDRR